CRRGPWQRPFPPRWSGWSSNPFHIIGPQPPWPLADARPAQRALRQPRFYPLIATTIRVEPSPCIAEQPPRNGRRLSRRHKEETERVSPERPAPHVPFNRVATRLLVQGATRRQRLVGASSV